MDVERITEELFEGEGLTRGVIITGGDETRGKTVNLVIRTPLGRELETLPLVFDGGRAEYYFPSSVLDGGGKILVQAVAGDGSGHIVKSPVRAFTVGRSLKGEEGVPDSPLSLGELARRLENFVSAVPVTYADKIRIKDGVYYMTAMLEKDGEHIKITFEEE